MKVWVVTRTWVSRDIDGSNPEDCFAVEGVYLNEKFAKKVAKEINKSKAHYEQDSADVEYFEVDERKK